MLGSACRGVWPRIVEYFACSLVTHVTATPTPHLEGCTRIATYRHHEALADGCITAITYKCLVQNDLVRSRPPLWRN